MEKNEGKSWVEMNLDDGWHSDNPNAVTCPECGSLDIEFYWQNYEPKAIRCNSCGFEEHDPK